MPRAGAEATDGQLLRLFLVRRDPAAFESIVRRHGPLVYSVCRRVLAREPDVEDAFQATFLVLLRRRGEPADTLDEVAVPDCINEVIRRDLRRVLDEEIERLPERFRAPFVLCYLQGKSNEEAARLLGCVEGTVSSRLARARERLRGRLARRGLALSAGLITTMLGQATASAAVPAGLIQSTTALATTAGLSAPAAAALSKGVMKHMFFANLKLAAASALLGAFVAGGTVFTYHVHATGPVDDPRPAAGQKAQAVDLVGIASPRDGVVAVVGTEIRDGENVKANDVVTIKVSGKERKFRRLRIGDRIEVGQLVARLDDRLAQIDVATKRSQVTACEADHEAALKTRDEALERFKTQQKLLGRNVGATSLEEVRGAKLTYDRYVSEEVAKQAAVTLAKEELKRAETILEMHEIRSRVAGVLREIYKHPGEGVRALEAVVQVQVARE